jgi:ubiquinone/menaquinone biosynthesis C-methylase UbiE
MTTETDGEIVRHYARDGLEAAIRDALAAMGRSPETVAPADLSPVDELHTGWRAATAALIASLGLEAHMRVLDLGSGLGGPARHMAEAGGCRVTGIDLTADYVAVANTLSEWCGLADRVDFRVGSAVDLPFEAGSFDAVTLIHVGMNIAGKAALFAGVRRVLKPGGAFGVYDVMRVGAGEIAWPMPWAAGPGTSFVETPGTYVRLLAAAGFTVGSQIDRTQLAQETARRAQEAARRDGVPPLGLHLIMGDERPLRIGNLMAALADGTLAPVEIIARAA